jgi:hypothetical protein
MWPPLRPCLTGVKSAVNVVVPPSQISDVSSNFGDARPVSSRSPPAVGAGRPDGLAETQLEELVVDLQLGRPELGRAVALELGQVDGHVVDVDGGSVPVDRPGEQPRDLQPERPDVTDVARLVARASFQGPGAAPAERAAGECRRRGQPAVRGTSRRFMPCEFVGGPTGGRWPSQTPRPMRARLGCRGVRGYRYCSANYRCNGSLCG